MIICLRPQPDCDADVTALKAMGIDAVSLPMLTIRYVDGLNQQLCRSDLFQAYQGIVITSKQASRYLCAEAEALTELARLPIWCIGEGSADSLHQHGYQLAYIGKDGARDLVDAVSQRASASDGPLLWLSGRDIHTDICACLTDQGFVVQRLIMYQAEAAHPSGDKVHDRLVSGEPVAAAVFSARTLTSFDSWLSDQLPLIDKQKITILAASPALAAQARNAGFAVRQAARPDRPALLALCQNWSQQLA